MIRVVMFFAVFFGGYAHAENIENLDEYEQKLESCLSSIGASNPCVANLLKKYLPPGNESTKPVADQIEMFIIKWLADQSVANVYPVYRKEIGGFMTQQRYIIEDSVAAIILFDITYRKAVGDWYVLKFNINSKPEEILKELDL